MDAFYISALLVLFVLVIIGGSILMRLHERLDVAETDAGRAFDRSNDARNEMFRHGRLTDELKTRIDSLEVRWNDAKVADIRSIEKARVEAVEKALADLTGLGEWTPTNIQVAKVMLTTGTDEQQAVAAKFFWKHCITPDVPMDDAQRIGAIKQLIGEL